MSRRSQLQLKTKGRLSRVVLAACAIAAIGHCGSNKVCQALLAF